MRSCVTFVGLLAVGTNCNHTTNNNNNQRSIACRNHIQDNSRHLSYQRRKRSSINHPAIKIRGGGGGTSTTKIDLSAASTTASLFAGSIGGAIGVGVSYPFDTLSTKAQVSTGKDEKHLSFAGNMGSIWKSDGISGFFDGVLVTVRDMNFFCMNFFCSDLF